jgi:MoxR-like ATPase
LGKTTLAYALARSTDCAFSRVQFTSDLWPSDVTGVAIYNARERSFVFKPGPVFANVVLAGEINRVTPKAQSALLEVMDRARVTLERGAAALKAWLEGPWDFRRLAMALMLTVGAA